MTVSLKKEILRLRGENKTYDEIKDLLGCSKATISYHCTRNGIGNNKPIIDNELVNQINDYYLNHTIDEVVKRFNISRSTVIRYTDNKRIKLSDEELRERNYNHVKTYRQKIKERAVEYKGGECFKCGYSKCIRALEFHHNDPKEKDFHLSSYKVLSWDKIKIELDKCILVCSNCHKEIHFELDKERITDTLIKYQ
jgi:hypothetical protein